MQLPSLTPFEALNHARIQGGFNQDGFTYTLDGPMMTPEEFLFPVVNVEGGCWYPAGDIETCIDESIEWTFVRF